MKETILKPCPFCGSKIEVHVKIMSAGIFCKTCGVELLKIGQFSKDEVVIAWNRRAAPAPVERINPSNCICSAKTTDLQNLFLLFVKRACPVHGKLWKPDEAQSAGKTVAQQTKDIIPQICPDCGNSDMQCDGDGHPKCSNCGRFFA